MRIESKHLELARLVAFGNYGNNCMQKYVLTRVVYRNCILVLSYHPGVERTLDRYYGDEVRQSVL